MNKVKELKELTSIRFFAAIHVVLFHNIYLLGNNTQLVPSWLQRAIGFGYCGVTFFFILSGFILSYVYWNGLNQINTSILAFYKARFSRIYPIYLLAFLIDLPRGLFYFLQSKSFGKIFITSFSYLTMLQSWHPRLVAAWNSPAWSISTEVFFYILFPFVIPLVFKIKKNSLCLIGLYIHPMIIYFIMTQIFHLDLESGFYETLWRCFPLIRVSEFLIGIFLAKFYLEKNSFVQLVQSKPQLFGRIFWFLIGISFVTISIDFSIPAEIFPKLILVPLFSLIILILATIEVPLNFLLNNKVNVFLGSASFALYMIHRPIQEYIKMIDMRLGLKFIGSSLVLYLFITILLSLIIYKVIELPTQRFLRRK